MLIYEVNLRVQTDVAEAYRAWLTAHIGEIVALDGFLDAHLWADTDAEPEVQKWVVHYHVATRADLDRYFADHAPRLRTEGLARFPDQFSATRRILSALR